MTGVQTCALPIYRLLTTSRCGEETEADGPAEAALLTGQSRDVSPCNLAPGSLSCPHPDPAQAYQSHRAGSCFSAFVRPRSLVLWGGDSQGELRHQPASGRPAWASSRPPTRKPEQEWRPLRARPCPAESPELGTLVLRDITGPPYHTSHRVPPLNRVLGSVRGGPLGTRAVALI